MQSSCATLSAVYPACASEPLLEIDNSQKNGFLGDKLIMCAGAYGYQG